MYFCPSQRSQAAAGIFAKSLRPLSNEDTRSPCAARRAPSKAVTPHHLQCIPASSGSGRGLHIAADYAGVSDTEAKRTEQAASGGLVEEIGGSSSDGLAYRRRDSRGGAGCHSRCMDGETSGRHSPRSRKHLERHFTKISELTSAPLRRAILKPRLNFPSLGVSWLNSRKSRFGSTIISQSSFPELERTMAVHPR